jgi:hypothetical protein
MQPHSHPHPDEVASRQQAYLQRAADRPGDEGTAIPRLAVGDIPGAVDAITRDLDHARRRQDCTDFKFNGLLRCLFLYRDRIPSDVQSEMKKILLDGRFHGGFRPAYPMFYNSENHRMAWHTAEYLTARLFPDETFTLDGRTARAHADRARAMIAWWIDQRARWGYTEWNSSTYMGVNLNSLLNLADFSDEPVIRALARDSVTKLFADLAADSLEGQVCGAQCRTYEGPLLDRAKQGVRPLFTLLLGLGESANLQQASATGDFVATTGYRPPEWLRALAVDTDKPLVNRECARMDPHFVYTLRGAFWRPPFEITDDAILQREYASEMDWAPIRTERCSEHLLSAMLNPRIHNYQMLVWMCSLRGRALIFTTHPTDRPREPHGDGVKRQEYWAGTCTTPRCHLKDGVLAALYRSRPSGAARAPGADFTHAYFPTEGFDEWQQDGRWFFARIDDGYAGLLAPPSARLTDSGDWAGKEVLAPGLDALWVCVCGSARQDGDFDRFRQRCRSSVVHHDPGRGAAAVRVGATTFTLDYAQGAIEDGVAVSWEGWPQMDNGFVHAEAGSPVVRVTTDDGVEHLDFSAARGILDAWVIRD